MAKRRKKTLKPGKEITISKADTLEKKLLKIPEEDIKKLVIDFSMVNAVDAVGLGLILATHNTMAAHQGSLQLINVPEEINGMFHAVGMDRLFEIHSC